MNKSDPVYCDDCGCEISKVTKCRGCGKVLCPVCVGTDGTCGECNRDAYEFVDNEHRKSTVQAY